jgi:beta-lactamase regulating signal transducer with metallopeptidase domain
MTTLLLTALSNALAATLLAVIAFFVGRYLRVPALAHTLWLLVLVKLITPPLVQIPVAWIEVEVPAAPQAREMSLQPDPQPSAKPKRPRPASDSTVIAAKRQASDIGTRGLLDPMTGRPLPPAIEEIGAKALIDLPEVQATTEDESGLAEASSSVPAPMPSASSNHFPWQQSLLGAWLSGTLVCIVIGGRRIVRFRRLLGHAVDAPEELQREFERIAARMGIRRIPRLRLVPGRVTPMLWAVGRPTVYFPMQLLQILSCGQRETLLVHELAHVKRRDHWVRWLEMLAASLFWWLPVCRLACRELRRVEEECCDAWVVDVLPDSGQQYAAALLDAVDFLTSAERPLPAPVCGIGRITFMRKRLRTILSEAPSKRLSLASRLALFPAACVLLSVAPTIGQIRVPVSIETDSPAARRTPIVSVVELPPEPFTFDDDPATFFHREEQNPVILSLAISPDGRLLAVGTDNKLIALWDLRKRKRLATLEGHADAVSGLAFSPDGQMLASASYDKTIKLWHLPTGTAVQTLTGHSKWVFAVAFSPDGTRLASGSYDRTIRVWDPVTGDVKAELRGHAGSVRSIAFSPDGKLLVSGSADHTVRVWFLDEERDALVLRGHRGLVRSVAFRPDGKTFASGGEDRHVFFWDVSTLTRRTRWDSGEDGIGALAYSPRGSLFVVATWNGQIIVLDSDTFEERSVFHRLNEAVTTLAIGPDGQPLAAGGYDRAVMIWPPEKEKDLVPMAPNEPKRSPP